MRKPTLRDVAKEAGVSVATVSYVLNNVSKQSIPDDTKQRVFEAASKLNYVQNLTAKALSLGKTNVIGVLIVNSADALIPRMVSYGAFLDKLERSCREQGYHLLVSQINPLEPSFDIIAERKLDGVFLIDALEHSFHNISSHLPYGTPLVLVDCLIDDPLFRSVIVNFEGAFAALRASGESSFAVIHEGTSNRLIRHGLQAASGLEASDICAVTSDEKKLRDYIMEQGDRLLVVFNEFLAMRVLKYCAPERVVAVCTSECPELLPERVVKFIPGESKGDVAFELLHALLKAPFGPYEDRIIDLQLTKTC